MMKFKSIGIKVAVLATVAISGAAVTAAPSQAADLTSGGKIQISSFPDTSLAKVIFTNGTITGLNFTGADKGKIQVDGATGGFVPYDSKFGKIKNLVYSGGAFQAINDFITINPDLAFDLSSVTTDKSATSATFNFFGTFSNSVEDIVGSGTLTTVVDFNKKGQDAPSAFSGTFGATSVPTPALLPGLVGMGVAALRKRKSEEETVEEAVEV